MPPWDCDSRNSISEKKKTKRDFDILLTISTKKDFIDTRQYLYKIHNSVPIGCRFYFNIFIRRIS